MTEEMEEKQVNEIRVFNSDQFGEVRTVTIDDEPWFVAADVCRALEIGNRGKTLVVNTTGEPVWSTPSGALPTLGSHDEGKALVVNDSGRVAWAEVLPTCDTPDSGKVWVHRIILFPRVLSSYELLMIVWNHNQSSERK